MKAILFIIVFLLLLPNLIRAHQIPYISPGVTLSWDLGSRFVVSPKISLGISANSVFHNITIGSSSADANQLYPHFFVEYQIGRLTPPSSFRKTQIYWGGGVGITVPTKHPSNVSFRCTAFAGYFVFANFTMLFREGIHAEIGPQIVLPIPLKRIESR